MTRMGSVAKIISDNHLRCYAELGVMRGETIFYLLEHLPDLHVVAVDLWASQDPSVYDVYRDDIVFEGIYKAIMIKAEQYEDRLTIMRMSTDEASEYFSNEVFDIIFIDANHSYEAAKSDLEHWIPKVVHNGFITGHDYGFKGVYNALKDVVGLEKIKQLGEVWYVKKNEIDVKSASEEEE